MIKIQNLKLAIMLEYQNVKMRLQGYTPNWSAENYGIKKVKNTVSWTLMILILMEKKFLEHFTKMNCKKQIKKNFEL